MSALVEVDDLVVRYGPAVALDGVTAHELSTQLGTILTWRRAGVDFVLAGSQPAAAAEAAARVLG